MADTLPQASSFEADAAFIRIVLSHCVSLVTESGEPADEGRAEATRLRVRKLLRLTDHYLHRAGDALPGCEIEEESDDPPCAGNCLKCYTCMNNYNNPSSPSYHNQAVLNQCVNCPCVQS